ncbi:MAG: LamG-like jellyroll fold domain-containing protein [bacterium]
MRKNNILLLLGIAVFIFGFQNLCADYIITTVAGTGSSGYSGDGGSATSAQLNLPCGVTADDSGNVYIADRNNHRVRKVNTSGTITTIAGNGSAGYSGDGGTATSAQLYFPFGVAVDSSGNVYIADYGNNRIRKINTSGIITTIAGNGSGGYSGDDGSATSAQLYYPAGVAVDGSGNIYIADYYNHRIRKVDLSGYITTIAGNGSAGYSGDGGTATSAQLYYPAGVAVDGAGNIYIADYNNKCIRKINTSGIINTIAGTGTGGYSGDDGTATSAQLNDPRGVVTDSSGNVYIADSSNNRIRVISTSGIITTIAGTGTSGYSGDDGAATSAQLNWPTGIAITSSGNIYIADATNNRIRKLTADSGGDSSDAYYEPNESFSAAYTISKDTTIYAYIWDSDDKDYYKFYITRAGTVTINLTSLPGDYDLRLYNSSQNQIAYSGNTGTADDSITQYLSAISVYYVYVDYYSGSSSDDTYCLSLSFAENAIPAQNLVGYWQFNDGSGTTAADSSGNGNTGTIYGGAAWVDGKYDGALDFDGSDDYVDAGAATVFNITGEFTLGAWIKTDSTDGTRNIITKGDNAYGMQLENNNAVQFYCGGGSLTTTENSVANNVWAHIAAVYTGSEMKIYINGTEKQSTYFYSNPQVTGETLKIGRHASSSWQFFSGCIDEVFVYSRALSADEIAALYPGDSAGGPADKITIGSNLIRRGSSDYTIIRTNVSQSGYLTVTVYDLAGKKVKEWSQYVDGSNTSFTWDGKMADGRHPPHGIYCIKVEGLGIASVVPVVIK